MKRRKKYPSLFYIQKEERRKILRQSNYINNGRQYHQKKPYSAASFYKEEKVTLTYCSPIGNYNSFDICQVIIYSNGYCKLGPDVWRELDRCDTSSYPVKGFKSIDEVEKKYVFRPELGCSTEKITKKIRRKYA